MLVLVHTIQKNVQIEESQLNISASCDIIKCILFSIKFKVLVNTVTLNIKQMKVPRKLAKKRIRVQKQKFTLTLFSAYDKD